MPPWLSQIGPNYIVEAFKAAREADPGAKLVLNERALQWGFGGAELRRKRLLLLLESLNKEEKLVDAVGLQSHLNPGKEGAIAWKDLPGFIRQIEDLDLKILVTDLDVRDTDLDGPMELRDQVVAETYNRYLDIFLASQATVGVLTWGFGDLYSSRNSEFSRTDGQLVRGTPYDRDMKRKPAWFRLKTSLESAPNRTGWIST